MNEIHFYLPESAEAFASLPRRVEDYWEWQSSAAGISAYWGRYHWVLQTYLYLLQAGLPVKLVGEMPDEGIVLTHRDCVEYDHRPSDRQLLVIMLVDRDVPLPRAAFHITHNPTQRLPFHMPHAYMPPWPQIGLIPRAVARGERFASVGYFGYEANLDPAIFTDRFRELLSSLQLELVIPPPAKWHDFSEIDAILAIRTLGRRDAHLNKPSLKLFNAWLAGVPAILGHESSCRFEGQPGTGYLEATSSEELEQCVRRLAQDPQLRSRIVSHGRSSVQAFTPERTAARWAALIERHLIPRYVRLRRGGIGPALQKARGSVLERLLWRVPGRFAEAPPPRV